MKQNENNILLNTKGGSQEQKVIPSIILLNYQKPGIFMQGLHYPATIKIK